VTVCRKKRSLAVAETALCFVSLKFLLSHSMSFKVIRNDTDECGVCKVSLVNHCKPKYVSYLAALLIYSASNIGVTLKSALGVTRDR